MPSNACTGHLHQLLADAGYLNIARAHWSPGLLGRSSHQAALNRACIVMCVSAWEAYVEELVRECLNLLRPAASPLGVWPALNATIRGQMGRFNTPSTDNVRLLISDAVGLPNVHHAWAWQNCTSAQAVHRLGVAMDLRHQIAHGVNPRPQVPNAYADQLPDFFLRLGRCTDRALRNHLITVLGISNPWPP